MDLKLLGVSIVESDADTLLIYTLETQSNVHSTAVDSAMGGAVQDLIASGDYTGKANQIAILYPRGALKAKRVLLVGLGNQITIDAVRRATATAIKRARELKSERLAIGFPEGILTTEETARGIAEGGLLGAYRYHGQKSTEEPKEHPTVLEIHVSGDSTFVEQGIKIGQAFAAGTIASRDLVNLPPNICTPIYLSTMARMHADRVGLKIKVLEVAQMEEQKMGAVLAVGQGSDNPPRFIILEHNADRVSELDTIVLVGKGVTFDTGGYSIKTAEGMTTMKADMSGAGAVIGAMLTISMLNLPLHVVGLAPAAENMVSGSAFRPQDVITASNGKTIEIISTDAEGRLLLADALVYAKQYNPVAVVDIATLTGACVVALGSAAAGFFCTDNRLRDQLLAAAEITQEKLWQLPLFPEYKKAIESETADMKNTGGRNSGVGTSATFLQQFVDYPAWAHIDMAGVMLDTPDNPYVPAKGGSGYGARLLAEFVRQWAEHK